MEDALSDTPHAAANARRYTSPEYFRDEMRRLAAAAWQFFCTTDDLAAANDWVRRSVFGVDVFVQNFHGELRGYHNVCQHRGFPLRRGPRGNGPVQCGFHGWVYNKQGIPTGIPRNQDLFCLSREQQAELAIPPVRVATVGRFVFVALSDAAPPIAEYLGRYADILVALSERMRAIRHRWSGPTAANWKLCFEITLDDYHAPIVHSNTLGAGGQLPLYRFVYGREGAHSYSFMRRDPDWSFDYFWDDLAARKYDHSGYKVHQLFPNLLIVTTPMIVLVSLYQPTGPASAEVEDLMFDLRDNEENVDGWEALTRAHRAVHDEDRVAVESQQSVVTQFERRPTFGRLEERVEWFQQAYESLVGADRQPGG